MQLTERVMLARNGLAIRKYQSSTTTTLLPFLFTPPPPYPYVFASAELWWTHLRTADDNIRKRWFSLVCVRFQFRSALQCFVAKPLQAPREWNCAGHCLKTCRPGGKLYRCWYAVCILYVTVPAPWPCPNSTETSTRICGHWIKLK